MTTPPEPQRRRVSRATYSDRPLNYRHSTPWSSLESHAYRDSSSASRPNRPWQHRPHRRSTGHTSQRLQGISSSALQALRYAVSPVRPCKTGIFEIYSPLVPRRFPSSFGACGSNHKISHQNEFSENIFSVSTFCRALVYDTMPGGYMKGVKAEKLKSIKST